MPDATTKNRQALRSRFVRHAIPTERDFADLINSTLNLADDGVVKLPDQPLGLVRQKPEQSVLLLYANPDADSCAWQMQLIGIDKPGLAFANQGGAALYLEGTTGNVGIGTSSPQAKLTLCETIGTMASASAGSLLIDHENAGGASSIVFRSKVNRVSDHAYIQYQDRNPGISDNSEAGLLTIGIENETNDHLALMPSGNVGIGTKTPAAKLHVAGNMRVDTELSVGSWPSGQAPSSELTNKGSLAIQSSTPQLDFIDTDSNAKDWAIRVNENKLSFVRSPAITDLLIDGTGNVGIGTTTPTHKLTVEGNWPNAQATGSDLSKAGTLAIRSNIPQLDFIDTDNNQNDWAIHVNEGRMCFVSAPDLNRLYIHSSTGNVGIGTDQNTHKLRVNGTMKVDNTLTTNAMEVSTTLTTGGNVGIGTTTPTHKLTVEGNWPDAKATGSDLDKAGILAIRSNTPQLDFIDTDDNSKDWAIHVNGSRMCFMQSPYVYKRMILQASGNVDIGEDSDTHKLRVNGTMKVDNTLTANAMEVDTTLKTGGSVGIGRSVDPDTRLAVNGRASAETLWLFNHDNRFAIDVVYGAVVFHLLKSANGNSKELAWTGGSGFHVPSDASLKYDIQPESDLLSRLLQLEVKSFLWKGDEPSTRRQRGFIAQEVQEIFPDLVESTHHEDGRDLLSVDYTAFGILCVASIKELKCQLDDELQSIRSSISDLRQQLQSNRGGVSP